MNPGEGNALELAAKRLERAVAQLENKLAAERAAARAAAAVVAPVAVAASAREEGDLFEAQAESRAARLAVDLEAARAREKALEEAGEQASEALGRAIAEIRAALGDESLITEGVHDDDEDEEGAEDGDFFPEDRPEKEA